MPGTLLTITGTLLTLAPESLLTITGIHTLRS